MRFKRSVGCGARSRGFSLVELMVTLVIGLIVIAAAAQVFVMVRSNYVLVQALSDRQNAVRFVTDSLIYDLRGAGRNGSIEEDGGNFEIIYSPPRRSSFYCDDVNDRLESITYALENGSILVEPVCESGSKGASTVVNGLAENGLVIEEILSRTAYRIRLEFLELSGGESAGSRTFVFRVANKDQVVSQNRYLFQ